MSIGTWLANLALSHIQKKAIEHFKKTTLLNRLHAAAEKWSQDLPQTAELLTVDAIFVQRTESSLSESAPVVRSVIAKLERFEIPSAEEWAEDFLVQWNWVRRNTLHRQPFFNISQDDAKRRLLELGQLLELECKTDQTCFQVMAIGHLESISANQELMTQLLQQLHLSQVVGEHSAQVAIKERQNVTSSPTGFHAEIDAAAEFIMKLQPAIAIVELEKLKTRHWNNLTEREKFRIVANLGHSNMAKNNLIQAGHYFIEAKQYQPTDEQARTLEAIGCSILGDRAKAFELSSRVRADFPRSDLGTATWVRNSPALMTFEDIESSIPTEFRTHVETAAALAWRALETGKLDVAESYARVALTHDPDSTNLREPLGIILLEVVCDSVRNQFTDIPHIADHEKLDEAVCLLQQSLAEITDFLPDRKAYIRFHLGRAASIAGNEVDAERHFFSAWEQQKKNPDYSRQYALCLCRRDDCDQAIQVLNESLSNDVSGQNSLLIASIRLDRAEPNDTSIAIDLLEGLLPKIATYDLVTRFEIINSLIFACMTTGEKQRIEEILSSLNSIDFPDLVLALIRSVFKRRFGDVDGSREEAHEAMKHQLDSVPIPLRRLFALHLHRIGFEYESLKIWKEIILPVGLGADTVDVLSLAQKCGDVVYVTEFCRELRRNGVHDREAIHLEINSLLEYNCFETAIEVMREIISAAVPIRLKREVQLRLSNVGIAIDRPEITSFDSLSLPTVEDCDPVLGITAVEVLSKGPERAIAIRYAYELVRRHFESHLAHRAVVISVLGNPKDSDARIVLDDPITVGPGCAVRYQESDTKREEWFIIEDGGNPESARLEYPPTNVLAMAMIGRRKGEEFQLRADPRFPRNATIVEIWTKFKFRFNRCLEEWEQRFPEKFFLWKFPIRTDDAGQPVIEDLLRSVDETIEATHRRDELYRENPLSATSYALLTEISVVDTIRHLSRQKLPIRCGIGNHAEVAIALKSLQNSRPLIIDGSALASLFLTNAYPVLPRLGIQLAVTEGTLLEWHRIRIEAERVPMDGGFLSKRNNQYVYYANDADEWRRYCQALKDFIQILKSAIKIEDGLPLARFPHEQRSHLTTILGRPAAETIAVAKCKGYAIWTDDRWVGEMAAFDFNLPRVWTAICARWFGDNELITSDERSRTIVELVKMGYVYTQIDHNDIEWAGRMDRWSPAGPNLSACLDWLRNPDTKDVGIVQIGIGAMKAVCRDAAHSFHRTTLVFQMEQAISSRSDGAGILRSIFRQIDSVAGFDQAASEVKEILLTSDRVRNILRMS